MIVMMGLEFYPICLLLYSLTSPPYQLKALVTVEDYNMVIISNNSWIRKSKRMEGKAWK